MASSGVNVLRFSALFGGIFYGIYHQRNLNAKAEQNKIKRKYAREEDLIQKAKSEYVKRNTPRDKLSPGGNVITDPDDPKFDLEAYLTQVADEAK